MADKRYGIFEALCNDTASCWYYIVSVTDEELNEYGMLVEWHGQVKTKVFRE